MPLDESLRRQVDKVREAVEHLEPPQIRAIVEGCLEPVLRELGETADNLAWQWLVEVEQHDCAEQQMITLRVDAPRRPSFEATLLCGDTGVTALNYIGRRATEDGLRRFVGVAEPLDHLASRYVHFVVDDWREPCRPPTSEPAARVLLVNRHQCREVDDPAEIQRLRWAHHRGPDHRDTPVASPSAIPRMKTAA
jgi:hypothetical protein